MKRSLIWWGGVWILWLASGALGAPANPVPQEVVQPDGTRIQLVQRGDESRHWTETPEGYSVVKNPQTGAWEYARQGIQALAFFSTGRIYVTDQRPPAGLKPHVRPMVYGAATGSGGSKMPANPVPTEVRQPDGRWVSLVQRGDERLHWTETPDGYAVVRNPETGFWEYAVRKPVCVLVPSGIEIRPSQPAPQGWPKHLKPSPKVP